MIKKKDKQAWCVEYKVNVPGLFYFILNLMLMYAFPYRKNKTITHAMHVFFSELGKENRRLQTKLNKKQKNKTKQKEKEKKK